MRKIKAGIQKEFLLLINDKVGLSMMIFLPVLLVTIITSIQNSAFNIVNNNQIELIVVNKDKDSLSNQFIKSIEESRLFKIQFRSYSPEDLNTKISESDIPFGLFIHKNYSQELKRKANFKVDKLKFSMGILETKPKETVKNNKEEILKLIYNPVIQGNYAQSVEQMVFTLNKKLSTSFLLNKLSTELELEEEAFDLSSEEGENELVMQKSSFNGVDTAIPNASQHNVPAWSIFAVFFMVISLAGNLVKEKINGSFDRVLTMPSSIWYLLGSKAILFLMVSLFQIALIFSISRFLFQYIELPTLYFPDNSLSFLWIVLLTGITAVNYSLLIGIYSKTVEQATGFGAISVIIFSAIGGIWVPSFIMPPLLKVLANISPLHWCIELFYNVFLKNGDFRQLLFPSFILIGMNFTFVLFAYIKLKKLNILVR